MTTKMTFTVNNAARDIQFVDSATGYFRAWITGDTGKGVEEVHDRNLVKGILHAFTDMALIHRYGTHTKGLHMKATIEELVGKIYVENIAYISNIYNGPIPVDGMSKLEDENNPLAINWGIANIRNGRLEVTKKMYRVAGTKTESDEIKHWRHAIDLMSGFEMLMEGKSLSLLPITSNKKNEETGEVTSWKKIIDQDFRGSLEILSAPTTEAASALVNERVAKKQSNISFARINATAARVQESGKVFETTLATVKVIQDRKTPFETVIESAEFLAGKVGYLFMGSIATSPLQPLDTPIVMEMIRRSNLSVLIAE